MEGEFKLTGFNTRQDLLEHQVKEYQIFMREQTAKIEELEEKLKVAVFLFDEIADSDLIASNLKIMARNASNQIKAK